jgi:cellulose synthase/poly-beta-1,6-N-acetylglucosamine synthase-like glycosyltransferase
MTLALALFHGVRSCARERVGVSAGLRGNGMCFSREALERVPHDAFSVVEDVEYGIKLGRAGIRVAYAGEAHVYGDMVEGEKSSRSQRERWESGRRALARQYGPTLLFESVRKRSGLLLDLAMDVLVPPLATLVALTLFGGLLSAAAVIALGRPVALVAPWSIATLMITIYVLRGVAMSGFGLRGLLDLLWAPVYIVWKLALRLRRSSAPSGTWVRTERAADTTSAPASYAPTREGAGEPSRDATEGMKTP